MYLGGRLLSSETRVEAAGVSVALKTPRPGLVVAEGSTGATVALTADVTAASGTTVAKVEYYQGGTYVGESVTAPYAVTWQSLTLPPGPYTFRARVVTTTGRASSSAPVTITLGAQADLMIYRPSNGYWNGTSASSNYGNASSHQWGLAGDVPVPGDFDGDAKADLTVYRPTTGEWFILYSAQGYNPATYGYYQWGLVGDVPMVTDFDGDGQSDLTVYRPSTGQWSVRYSSTGYSNAANQFGVYQWGIAGDIPIAGDFDGDNKTDLGHLSALQRQLGHHDVVAGLQRGQPHGVSMGPGG